MHKLSKLNIRSRDALAKQYEDARAELRNRVALFNTQVDEAYGEVISAQEDYDKAVKAITEFAGEISKRVQSAVEARSEKFQETEKGQSLFAFAEAWEDFESECCESEEFEEPDHLEFDADDLGETFLNVPVVAEGHEVKVAPLVSDESE